MRLGVGPAADAGGFCSCRTPDAQKLIKTATKLPTGVFCLLLLHYSSYASPLTALFFLPSIPSNLCSVWLRRRESPSLSILCISEWRRFLSYSNTLCSHLFSLYSSSLFPHSYPSPCKYCSSGRARRTLQEKSLSATILSYPVFICCSSYFACALCISKNHFFTLWKSSTYSFPCHIHFINDFIRINTEINSREGDNEK